MERGGARLKVCVKSGRGRYGLGLKKYIITFKFRNAFKILLKNN